MSGIWKSQWVIPIVVGIILTVVLAVLLLWGGNSQTEPTDGTQVPTGVIDPTSNSGESFEKKINIAILKNDQVVWENTATTYAKDLQELMTELEADGFLTMNEGIVTSVQGTQGEWTVLYRGQKITEDYASHNVLRYCDLYFELKVDGNTPTDPPTDDPTQPPTEGPTDPPATDPMQPGETEKPGEEQLPTQDPTKPNTPTGESWYMDEDGNIVRYKPSDYDFGDITPGNITIAQWRSWDTTKQNAFCNYGWDFDALTKAERHNYQWVTEYDGYTCGVEGHICQSQAWHDALMNYQRKGCQSCGSKTCPCLLTEDEDGWTWPDYEKCPQYDKHNDPREYCQKCGKPVCKAGRDPKQCCLTVNIAMPCPFCNEELEPWKCHTCK